MMNNTPCEVCSYIYPFEGSRENLAAIRSVLGGKCPACFYGKARAADPLERERKGISAQGRTCRWCPRTDADTPWTSRENECSTCDRAAKRNGRAAEGRPLRLNARGNFDAANAARTARAS